MLAKSVQVLFWLSCLAIALASLRILVLGPEVGFPAMAHQMVRPVAFWTHVLAASTALLLLPFQFWQGLRNRHRSVHRLTGRIYVAAVALGGLSGLMLAPFAATGTLAATGFFLLALAWLTTTGIAYTKARARDIDAHQRWMLRSAALTFAAVTLRIYIPLSFALQIPFETSYPVIAWACWVPNLLVVELWRSRPRPLAPA